MFAFKIVLKVLAAAFVGVAALHLLIGLNADAMLGVSVSPQMLADPSLDSQNRFYGITFSLMGIALWIGQTDLRRFGPIVLATLIVLFFAGIARVLAWVLHGAPAPMLIAILAADLILPPALIAWFLQIQKRQN